MAQIFHHSTNTLSRLSIFGAVFLIAFSLWAVLEVNRGPLVTQQNVVRAQPVPFSHQHHVGGMGIDCRYCHDSVEISPQAGMPPTKTCMNCHSQIWNQSPMLEPVRESFRTDKSIEWTRVHDLPDFAYFNHAAHVNKGVGCSTCHGRVDRMPLMAQAATLQMEWCLECHRAPERFVRKPEKIFDMAWRPENKTKEELDEGRSLVQQYHIQDANLLTSCSTCHR